MSKNNLHLNEYYNISRNKGGKLTLIIASYYDTAMKISLRKYSSKHFSDFQLYLYDSPALLKRIKNSRNFRAISSSYILL